MKRLRLRSQLALLVALPAALPGCASTRSGPLMAVEVEAKGERSLPTSSSTSPRAQPASRPEESISKRAWGGGGKKRK